MDDFILRALIAGLLLTLMTGPLGCFIVWRRLSYFGDTLAHAALLGIALSLLSGLPSQISVFVVSSALALILSELQRRKEYSSDSLLGLMSHSALALGLVVIALLGPTQISLESLLFGDILLVGWSDIVMILGACTVTFITLALLWRPMVAATLSADLAAAEGLRPRATQLALTLLIAMVIAVSIKLVGALLITAMLILPATLARGLSKTPEQMAVFATLAGMISIVAGIAGSWFGDTPTGPTIVIAALGLFLLTQFKRRDA